MPECGGEKKEERSTWARFIKKVYGTDPLLCPACASEMKTLDRHYGYGIDMGSRAPYTLATTANGFYGYALYRNLVLPGI
jgi:hypothetical protein